MPAPNSQADHEKELDLLIVGLGPAGVACALQARREGLRLLAVGDEPVGGLLPAARRLDNLPTASGMAGAELARRMAEQLDERGVDCTEGRVTTLAATADGHAVGLADGRGWRARCVCLATGTRPRHWPVALEGGRWVHRDARSVPARLDGLRAAVIGGGEAALDTALSLRDRGAGVELWVRGRRLRAGAALQAEAQAAGVRPIWSSEPVRARRQGPFWELTARDGRRLVADELVVCIGRERRDELLAAVPPQPDAAEPIVYRPGLFVAGDLIRGRDRYTATAMGDGQRAAVACMRHLSGADPPTGQPG